MTWFGMGNNGVRDDSQLLNNKNTGNRGEDIAASFLLKCGYRILERNFVCRWFDLAGHCLQPLFLQFQFNSLVCGILCSSVGGTVRCGRSCRLVGFVFVYFWGC